MIAIRNISQRNFSANTFPPAIGHLFLILRRRQWGISVEEIFHRLSFNGCMSAGGDFRLTLHLLYAYAFLLNQILASFSIFSHSLRLPFVSCRLFSPSFFFCSPSFGDMNDKWIMSVAFVFIPTSQASISYTTIHPFIHIVLSWHRITSNAPFCRRRSRPRQIWHSFWKKSRTNYNTLSRCACVFGFC